MMDRSPAQPSQMQDELRPALYHRLHWLLPFVAGRTAKRCWQALGWLLLFGYFAFAALILTLRYAVLPDIERYRGDIEQAASQAIGLPVRIGSITAGWSGLQPDLTLADVTVADAAGRPALAFSRVEAILSWSSLPRRQLRLALLAIDEPVLHVRRDAAGKLFVAGIPVEGESDFDAPGWVLAQQRIRINGATLVWEDEQRGAPPLILEDLTLALDNAGRHHRLGINALPPAELASRIDFRADLVGRDFADLDGWQGKLFAEFDYVDLAGWRSWIDYPVALPQGKGAMRAWLTVGEGRLLDLTTDLALSEVRLQLAQTLPELRLTSLNGRLAGRLRPGGFSASGKALSLGLADGTAVPPTDFAVDWQAEADGRTLRGSGTASRLDLQRLARLAAYLPLDAASRKLLDDYAPSGEITDLRLSFSGDAERLHSYSLRARFSGLGLRAQAYFPGFFGLSGQLEASEKGGSVNLRAQNAGLDLPVVFPEPRLAFDSLAAQAKWKIDDGRVDVDLTRVEFAGHDAAGSAQGHYRLVGDGPGVIDLTASLSRARGDAVWRYMPHAVDAEARDWLRRGIRSGSASNAKLTLKGDLARFPFIDGSGTFLVTAKAHDVTLDYAPGWPLVEHIDGDLRFAGAGMHIEAQRGAILGTRIGHAVADIPDFDAESPVLAVRGKVDGPTGEFFRFIESSPLGEILDHPTSEMKAVGNGKLDLALDIPLSNLDNTRVKGNYLFVDNQLTLDPVLPPLTQVNGVLGFSENAISVRDINGAFLGGPVKVRADTRGGRIDVLATGSLAVAQARRHYELPIFDRLSGNAGWRAEVKVTKGATEIVVDSTLAGISSSLPPPFNKTAAEALPLRFEKGSVAAATVTTTSAAAGARKAAGGRSEKNGNEKSGGEKSASGGSEKIASENRNDSRDRIQITVGKSASAQLLRRRDAGGKLVPERGALAIGVPLVLPERGITVAVVAPEVDLDLWRQAFAVDRADPAATDGTVRALLPDQMSLRTATLKLAGRPFHDVDLHARSAGGTWQVQLAAREANGELQFDPFGRGALRARLKNFVVTPGEGVSSGSDDAAAQLEDLPALDVVADSFAVGDKKLGRLEVQARNEASSWRIEKLTLANADGRLDGSGAWRMQAPRRFDLEFKLATDNIGGLLERLGYVGAVKRGSATLSGRLAWAGVPVQIDYPSLAGTLNLDASRGQFAKLDPGATGKLLGLISLQALPRRITLDFQDVFSEGFAFDSIKGKMDVKSGLMHTDRLQIDGPSARVLMRGDVDLQHETQKLVVNVQPELGGTAALGVALINPLAGAATLLAHKVLQNPLNQIFSFDYGITGTWDDPKVEKLSAQRLSAQSGSGEKHESTQ